MPYWLFLKSIVTCKNGERILRVGRIKIADFNSLTEKAVDDIMQSYNERCIKHCDGLFAETEYIPPWDFYRLTLTIAQIQKSKEQQDGHEN